MIVRQSILDLEDSPIVEVWRLGLSKPDVIGLWAGEPDVPTPDFICEAAIASLRAGRTFYGPNRGVPELRQAISDYVRRLYGANVSEDRLAVTASGMNAVMLVAQAVMEPGGNAVVVTPSWPNVMRAMAINGGEIRSVPLTSSSSGWRLDLDRLFAACDGRTRAIYYASPGNPTGWVLEDDDARRLLDFARERDIAILADEVYHRLVYDRPVAPSLLEFAEPDDPVFVVNSFSKAWAMTGWRLGWLVYPAGLLPQFEKLIQFNTSGAQTFLQEGAIAALRHGEPFVASFLERCRTGRDLVARRLGEMPRLSVVPNSGSFYTMFSVEGVGDTLAFCKRAVAEAGVGMAPGTAFGGGAEAQVRLCYAKSPERLTLAMDRLAPFIDRYAEG